MNKGFAMIIGAGVGAGLMYLYDPQMGSRRRALTRDKLIRVGHRIDDAVDVASRDLTNRAVGVWAELRSSVAREEVGDEVLAERVRSQLGGLVSHPRAIEVRAEQGRVTLSGPVLSDEAHSLLKGVASVRGVCDVENRLDVHDEPRNVPGLQGQPVRRLSGQQWDFMQRHWSPTARLLMGGAGGALAAYGAGRRDVFSRALGLAGLTMLARAITNIELKRLIGVGAGRRAVDIQKTITITAPIERVFELWAHYQNFPHFMSNVRDVKDLGDGRSRWIVTGPAGTTVEWDAVMTSYTPREVLAWRTEPNSIVQHAGVIRFLSNSDGSTTVNIRLTYNPGVGGLGHIVASLFGADPKSQMDEDLVRMKTFIETGKVPSDAAAQST
ncbi:MAG: SRPBCC family protein [Candidatus Entotheonellia bacterium]